LIAEGLVRELAHIFKNDRKTYGQKLIELPNLTSNALCAVGCIPLMECTMVKQFLR